MVLKSSENTLKSLQPDVSATTFIAAAKIFQMEGMLKSLQDIKPAQPYFEDDGELILVDYKTDRTWSSRVLLDHYKRQLDYYERALTQLTGKKVREKWIYSLTMQRAIPC